MKFRLHKIRDTLASESIFQDACEVLLHAALGDLPDNLLEQIAKNEVIDEVIGGRHIHLEREYFSGGISDGYSKILTISHKPAQG